MDDLQATLQSLLENPQELEELAQTASQLLGVGGDQESHESSTPEIGVLMRMLQKPGDGSVQKLADALKPFLSDARRVKLERAARLASLSSLAEFALGE